MMQIDVIALTYLLGAIVTTIIILVINFNIMLGKGFDEDESIINNILFTSLVILSWLGGFIAIVKYIKDKAWR